ncbi:hypothetical protein AVEN_20520-1 [Araneus ventricosus]|uniref:Uncharacterized protein n=1 Tax=Araneus ventricosus TaxID=182803 RepID=A0A4Y2UVS5_ARAVE|nr:hypothetical protein AVEN_20520-1 [Araneus ventricosus]
MSAFHNLNILEIGGFSMKSGFAILGSDYYLSSQIDFLFAMSLRCLSSEIEEFAQFPSLLPSFRKQLGVRTVFLLHDEKAVDNLSFLETKYE